MVTERQETYEAEVKALFASYATEMGTYNDRLIGLLKEVQESITDRIEKISPTDWERLILTNISSDIDEILTGFTGDYNQLMAESLLSSAENGIDSIVQPLRNSLNVSNFAFEPNIFKPVIFDESYQQMLRVSATFITGATEETSRYVINKIVIGMVENLPRHEVIEGIIGELGGEKLGFKTLNQRAWAIFRTENGRMSSLATELQMSYAKELIPGAEKVWFHGVMTGLGQTPRPGHVELDGKHIPVDETFIDPVTGDMLRYPHDVLAPATALINCGCAHTLYMPDDIYLKNNTLIIV